MPFPFEARVFQAIQGRGNILQSRSPKQLIALPGSANWQEGSESRALGAEIQVWGAEPFTRFPRYGVQIALQEVRPALVIAAGREGKCALAAIAVGQTGTVRLAFKRVDLLPW